MVEKKRTFRMCLWRFTVVGEGFKKGAQKNNFGKIWWEAKKFLHLQRLKNDGV